MAGLFDDEWTRDLALLTTVWFAIVLAGGFGLLFYGAPLAHV